MEVRELGNSGIKASVVAFGAWAIGGWKWGGTDAQASIKAIQASIDNGVNFIDTAAVYGFGLSEELVGKAIEGCNRQSLVIASKCGLRWDCESPTLHVESEGKRVYRILTADSIELELERSLKRLNTDYIDLYLTHWPDPNTAPEDVMQTLLKLKSSGKIRAIGFCNSSSDALIAARSVGPLDADQERYSMLDREQDSSNLPLCESTGMAFLAYSPMAQGLLSGKIDAKREFAEGDLRKGNPRFAPEVLEHINKLLAPISELAMEKQLTIEQLVLAWTLKQPGVSHVLVGARSAEQAISNATTGSVVLSDSEITIIDAAAKSWPGFDHFA